MTTLVDTTTGEITERMTEREARAITTRIRLGCDAVADRLDQLVAHIDQARRGQADAVLGYASWTAYVEGEFARALPRLDKAQRQGIVARLSDMGMSTRAIAPVVGVSHEQVRQDAGVKKLTPAPAPVRRHDVAGESKVDLDEPDVEIVDAEIVEDEPAPKITGRDGKDYPRPAPRAEPNRKPITDAFRDKTSDLLKIVKALTDLSGDDRFARNKEQVAARNRSDLQRALDALSGVIAQLD